MRKMDIVTDLSHITDVAMVVGACRVGGLARDARATAPNDGAVPG